MKIAEPLHFNPLDIDMETHSLAFFLCMNDEE